MKILLAGDDFVRPALLAGALRDAVADDAGGTHAGVAGRLEFSEVVLPWPHTPFGPVEEVEEACGDPDELIVALRGVEVVMTQMAPLTERVLAAADALALVVVTRGGPVNVNVSAARARGIAVCSTPGRNAPAAAEYAIGMILAANRRIPYTHGELRGGAWRGDQYGYDACGAELAGSTVGLVGFGAIGRRVARILAAFDARVLVADPFVDAAAVVAAGAEPVALADLLERSDTVSLHSRLSARTRGLIGPAELARMSPGSMLVNTARGGLLDTEALCDALESGHLGGAALDVFDTEPIPPGSRLCSAPGLVITPHLAGASRQTAERAARIGAAEVVRHLRGEPLAHPAG